MTTTNNYLKNNEIERTKNRQRKILQKTTHIKRFDKAQERCIQAKRGKRSGGKKRRNQSEKAHSVDHR